MPIQPKRKPLEARFYKQNSMVRIDWDNVSYANCKDQIEELFKPYGEIKFFYRSGHQILMYLENYDNAMLASRSLNGTRWPDGSEIKFKVEEKLTSSFLHAVESLFFSIS